MDSLQVNHIQHSIVNVDNKTYLMSGVLFKYADQNYKLCLMTEKSVLLDNNTYLGIKVEMETFVIVILMALVLIAVIYAFIIRRSAIRLDEREADVKALSRGLAKVNEMLADKDLHDTHNNVWKQKAIVPFVEKLMERNVHPVTFARIECETEESRRKFFERAVYILDKHVLRFEYGACDIVLIAVNITTDQLKHGISILEDKEVTVQRVELIDNNTDMEKLRERYL